MAVDLEIINNLSVASQGVTTTAKQGAIADGPSDVHVISVAGDVHQVKREIATATVHTVFDDDDDQPTDFDYLHLWTSCDMYIQIIGSGSHVVFKVYAKTPFTMTYDTILAAANTTAITGGAEPSLTDIDSILVGNYSGSAGNYVFTIVD